MKDGITRIVNRGEFDRYVNEVMYQNIVDGINTLTNVVYQYDENIDEDSGNEEKLLVINTDKIESKKKRGRPSLKNKAKNNAITIGEENINLDI